MATYYVSSTENPNSSSGNAGTLGDPMGLSEGLNAAVAGDEVRVMADGTYTLIGAVTVTSLGAANNPIIVTGANSSGSVDGTKAVIHQSTVNTSSIVLPDNSHRIFRNLDVESRNRFVFNLGTFHTFEDCIGRGFGGVSARFARLNNSVLIRCEWYNSTGHMLDQSNGVNFHAADCYTSGTGGILGISSSACRSSVIGCIANACTVGFAMNTGFNDSIVLKDCIAVGCTNQGFRFVNTQNGMPNVLNCISYGNGGSGFEISSAANQLAAQFDGCIAVNNGGYGFANLTTAHWRGMMLRKCYGHGNTSGLETGPAFGAVNALGGDPFVDGNNRNFMLASNAAADTLKAVRVPLAAAGVAGPFAFRRLLETLSSGGGTRAYWG